MEKAKRVFAVLGLAWVINILMILIFPRTTLKWHTFGENLWFLMTGSLPFQRESMGFRAWLVAFSVAPACLIVLVGIRTQSVIARIKKARGERLCE